MCYNGRMVAAPMETERKWVLLQHPARRQLDAWADRIVTIDQVYLPKYDGVRRRLRKSVTAGRIEYELCSKRRLAPGVAHESTIELSADEHDLLLSQADPRRCPVRKTRWVFGPDAALSHPGALEVCVDHLITPSKLWVAEIEYIAGTPLEDGPALPEWLGAAVEVTHIPGWTCAAIARHGVPPIPTPTQRDNGSRCISMP